MTSKERASLRSLAHKIEPVVHIGKEGVTAQTCNAAAEALEKRELIKVSVLKNCEEDVKEVAIKLSERTRSALVQVMGRKITLYKFNNKKDVHVSNVRG